MPRIFNVVKSIVRKVYTAIRFCGSGIFIGSGGFISTKCVMSINQGGTIKLGSDCEIHDYAMLMSYGGDITVGNNCSINPFCVLYGHGGLVIGEGVRIATHTVIVPANHSPGDEEIPLYKRGVVAQGIKIGDYSWIGAGSRILDGVEIGRHAIVGAGSVVTKSVPDFATVAGVPAKIIDSRHEYST